MKKYFLSICIFLTSANLFGQARYEPSILILVPNEITNDKRFEDEIDGFNRIIRERMNTAEREKALQSDAFKKQPENIQKIIASETMFLKTLNFNNQISYSAEQYLAYRLFEKFPNMLLLLKDSKVKADLSELKNESEEANVQYILNFPKLEFYSENGSKYAKVYIQFYDRITNSVIIKHV